MHGGKACTQEPRYMDRAKEEQGMEEGNRSIRARTEG